MRQGQMRLSDIGDWLALRRHLAEPWDFLRMRKRELAQPYCDVRLRDGGSLRLRATTEDRRIFHNIFARDEYDLTRIPAGTLDTVIDVGAHIGAFAVRVAPVARRVLCYEPDPANYALLIENVRRFPHVRTFQKAVAGRRATATLYLADEPSAHSMLRAASGVTRVSSLAVEAVTLADICAEHGLERCDLLKLDCEGAEYEILYSAPRELWDRIARLAMEFHDVPGGAETWTANHLAKFLEGVGHRPRLRPRRKHPAMGMLFSVRC